jgi:hypothetical protein
MKSTTLFAVARMASVAAAAVITLNFKVQEASACGALSCQPTEIVPNGMNCKSAPGEWNQCHVTYMNGSLTCTSPACGVEC